MVCGQKMSMTDRQRVCEAAFGSLQQTSSADSLEALDRRLAACQACSMLASRGCGQLHPCNARWPLWLAVITAGSCSHFNGDSTITESKEGESEMSDTTTRPTEAGLYFAVVKQPASPGLTVPPSLAGRAGAAVPNVTIPPNMTAAANVEPSPYAPYNAIVELSGESPYLEIAVLFFGAVRNQYLRPRRWSAKEIEFGARIAPPAG
jgi:hypothetical protein